VSGSSSVVSAQIQREIVACWCQLHDIILELPYTGEKYPSQKKPLVVLDKCGVYEPWPGAVVPCNVL
jgi:hypothetical protein